MRVSDIQTIEAMEPLLGVDQDRSTLIRVGAFLCGVDMMTLDLDAPLTADSPKLMPAVLAYYASAPEPEYTSDGGAVVGTRTIRPITMRDVFYANSQSVNTYCTPVFGPGEDALEYVGCRKAINFLLEIHLDVTT